MLTVTMTNTEFQMVLAFGIMLCAVFTHLAFNKGYNERSEKASQADYNKGYMEGFNLGSETRTHTHIHTYTHTHTHTHTHTQRDSATEPLSALSTNGSGNVKTSTPPPTARSSSHTCTRIRARVQTRGTTQAMNTAARRSTSVLQRRRCNFRGSGRCKDWAPDRGRDNDWTSLGSGKRRHW